MRAGNDACGDSNFGPARLVGLATGLEGGDSASISAEGQEARVKDCRGELIEHREQGDGPIIIEERGVSRFEDGDNDPLEEVRGPTAGLKDRINEAGDVVANSVKGWRGIEGWVRVTTVPDEEKLEE